ncbi:MAG: hypothetical protein IJF67_14090 [Clostridia bacterium]|nr:hypothetical protein [Clostridia bacterium]
MLDRIFLQIFDMSKVAAIVILAVLLVRLCLRRAPKIFAYALWAVVLFRLLCPITIEAPLSLIPAVTPAAQEFTAPIVSTPDSAVTANPDTIVPLQPLGGTSPIRPGESPAIVRSQPPCSWYTLVWLAGIAAMLIRSGISLARLRAKLLASVRLRDNIYLADDIPSPFVMGLIRPRIYLPSSLSETERGYILLHEQHHIRRGDHIAKLLAFAALCLHWFNPLVWAAFILSGKDMEMSCDEAVLAKLGGDIRADYTASLISLATGRRIIAGAPLAFGEGETLGRVKNLARWKKPAVWVIVVCIVLCLVLAVCLATNRAARDTQLWGAEYRLAEVVYRADERTATDERKFDRPWICIGADFSIWVKAIGSESWVCFGKLEPYALDNDKLAAMTAVEDGWIGRRPGRITDAYALVKGSVSFLFCCTNRGEVLYGVFTEEDGLWFLHRLESTFGGTHLTGEFHERSLAKTVGGDVEIFHTHYNESIPGYMIVGFRSDASPYQDGVQLPSPEKTDMGFAVFASHRDESGFRLLQCHVYEDAALAENGIFLCPDPAVLHPAGEMVPKRTFDVILLNNEHIAKATRVWQYADSSEKSETASYLNGREMVLYSWENDRAGCRIWQYFYDEAGERIDYSSFVRDDSVQTAQFWVDYFHLAAQPDWLDAVPWDLVETHTLPDHPGTTFTFRPGQITAENEESIRILLSGSPIWNAFFCDLTGDGLAELCVTANYGEGVTATMVSVCDIKNDRHYALIDFNKFDYSLRIVSGQLICDKRPFRSSDVIDSGRLVIEDGALKFESIAVAMTPTAADVVGAFDAYLYVPMDGDIYRFELANEDAAAYTRGAEIYRFIEEADPKNVEWRVYAVKEVPDGSAVIAEAGEDYRHLYRYSRAKAANPAELAQAKANGKIVLEDGAATSGEALWQAFVDKTARGEADAVEIVHWYTLERGNYDAKYLEVYREDYPALHALDLMYDGKAFTLRWEEAGTPHELTYQYLRKFEDTVPSPYSAHEPQSVTRYVLTNHKTADWDDLTRGMLSADFGDYISFFTVYSEKN